MTPTEYRASADDAERAALTAALQTTPRRGRSSPISEIGENRSESASPAVAPSDASGLEPANAGIRAGSVNPEIHMTHVVQSRRCIPHAAWPCSRRRVRPLLRQSSVDCREPPTGRSSRCRASIRSMANSGSASDTRLRTIVTRPAGVRATCQPSCSCNGCRATPSSSARRDRRLDDNAATPDHRVGCALAASGEVGRGRQPGTSVLRARLRDRARPASRGAATAAQTARCRSDAHRDLRREHGLQLAPLLAAGQDVAGVVVWGGGAMTWFERMLRFERNALELGDTDPAQLAVRSARARRSSRDT